MQVGLIGMGNLGTAVANLVAQNGYDVLGWEYQAPLVEEINTTRTNGRYLEGIQLDPKLSATTEIMAVLKNSEILFIAIPSVFVQSTLAAVSDLVPPETIIVNMAKGIDGETGLTS